MSAFFICRPMALDEWLALPPRMRFCTEDMTDASVDRAKTKGEENMTRIVFQPIKLRREVKTFCTACAVKLRRSVTVEHTVNPWNKNPDGTPKTPDEVYVAVCSELDARCKELEMKGTRCRKHTP